jgi:hypothetical protein
MYRRSAEICLIKLHKGENGRGGVDLHAKHRIHTVETPPCWDENIGDINDVVGSSSSQFDHGENELIALVLTGQKQ